MTRSWFILSLLLKITSVHDNSSQIDNCFTVNNAFEFVNSLLIL